MASTFRFVWDGNVLLHETFKKDNSENTELTTWVFEGFLPTAKLVNGKAYSIIRDHLGTPILAVDSEGNQVWNRELEIYGRVRHEFVHPSFGGSRDQRVCERGGFPFIPFLYQGQYYDFETKLAYNRFRYYSSETGSYISQDPIGLMGGDNLYSYVLDVNVWLDVFGLAKEFEIGTYGSLKGGDNIGDELDAHELLQNAWLEHNANVSRGVGRESLDNPAIALGKNPMHSRINRLQQRYNLYDKNTLLNQSALENINKNTALTRRAIMEGLIDKGMDRDKAKTLATAMALKLRDNAIAHAKKYGYINNNCP